MKKGVKAILLVLCFVLLLGGTAYCIKYGTLRKEDKNEDFYSDATAMVNEAENAIGKKTYKSIILSDSNSIRINNPGIYELSGSAEDITICIDTEDDVILILNNVSLVNREDAVLDIENAKAVLVYLLPGSENTIISGEETEILSSEEDQSGAAIYSKDNLYFSGNGSLTVNGYINNAVLSNDSLLFLSGNYNIKAINNGLKAHDNLQIYDGTYSILSGNDGIKAEYDEDVSLGNINIYGGEISITSYGDGISAMTDLMINGGNITISSPDSTDNNSSDSLDSDKVLSDKTEKQMNRLPGDTQENYGQPGKNFHGSSGKENSNNNSNWAGLNKSSNSITDSSAKGLKAGNSIEINNGTINIATEDDAIHSDNDIVMNGGNITISCSDDGIHADNVLTMNDGEILIENSYEGIEGHQIYIKNGTISLYASDDGFNASGYYDCILEFDGGNIYVNASGDGLDSNGDLIVNGGTIIVDGPTNSGNGPLDSGSENGGSLIVNGGELLAIGAKGMDESFDSSSSQPSLHLQTSSNYSAGSSINILDENNEVIYTYTSKKTFSSIVYTSSLLKEDASYYIVINNDTYTVSANDESSNFGNNGFPGMNGKGNGFGKGRH